jgi:hypothetical protein
MPEFVVYRHGWNKINQDPDKGLPEKMAVARIEAENADDACRLAKPQSGCPGAKSISHCRAGKYCRIEGRVVEPQSLSCIRGKRTCLPQLRKNGRLKHQVEFE